MHTSQHASTSNTYLPSIVEHRELSLVFELFGFGKLDMVDMGVHQLLYEGNICGFGEPTLLIQQSQDTWRVVLQSGGEIWD